MESEREIGRSARPVTPSVQDAAAQLRHAEALRERAESSGPSRAYATLMLWGAGLTSAYIFAFLLSVSADSSDAVATASPATLIPLLLLPTLTFGLLNRGARDRFSIRTVASRPQIVANALLLTAIAGLAIASAMSISYPWWVNLLVGLGSLVALGRTPFKQMQQAPRETQRWKTTRLSRSSSAITASYGGVLGLSVAASSHTWFSYVAILALCGVLVLSSASPQRASFVRVGCEWGPSHWIAFGLTTTIAFCLVPLLTLTTLITPTVAIACGVLIALIMCASALMPFRPRES